MARLLAPFGLFLLVLLSATVSWARFDPPGLAADAGTYATELRLKAPPHYIDLIRNFTFRPLSR